MATSQSGNVTNSKGNNRLLPSISCPGFVSSKNDSENGKHSKETRTKNSEIKRRSFHGFRRLFSSHRSSRSKSIECGENLPSISPQPHSISPQPPSISPQPHSISPQPPSVVLISPSSSTLPLKSKNSDARSPCRNYVSVETSVRSLSGIRRNQSSDTHRQSGGSHELEGNHTSVINSTISLHDSLGKNDDKAVNISMSSVVQNEKRKIALFQNEVELRKAFKQAKARKDFSVVVDYMTHVFNSLRTLSEAFKATAEADLRCGYNVTFIDTVFHLLMKLPSDSRKAILKSVVNCLLNSIKRNQNDDDLPGYLILLQNPQFDKSSSYVIFSNLLRQISSLSDKQHQVFIEWMAWLPPPNFKDIIHRLKEFIRLSQFPNDCDDIPSPEKTTSWVPSAVKVLALCNASNWFKNTPIVSHNYMYIAELDKLDLLDEYSNWQRKSKFSFCQYPFLLTLRAKRFLLQKDSEMQMIDVARRSLLQGVRKRMLPVVSMLFLNLRVRRDHLISDSLNEISLKRADLKKKLKVTFVGEPGVDMGGLTKEWFMLLIRKVFRPEYGMFRYNDKSSCYWFTNMAVDNLAEFNLVGVLMGLAVYNGTILDIRFPLCCYTKLLCPSVVPTDRNAPVGVTKLTLADLKEVMPELANGLQELLYYEGNVEEDMCQMFQVSSTRFGSIVTENLIENGELIAVTNANRQMYVDLYVDYILNKSISSQFAAFYHGFHSVCASNALIMLRPHEIEMLVCGNPDFDMKALAKVTTYDGFSKDHPTIRYFWEIVEGFTKSLKRKLLRFCTGSDRIPVGGMSEMDFKITRMMNVSDEMLPMAHTCFNQLCLPPYKTRQQLKAKLTVAISNSEGFGIE